MKKSLKYFAYNYDHVKLNFWTNQPNKSDKSYNGFVSTKFNKSHPYNLQVCTQVCTLSIFKVKNRIAET